jgi:hypothetical protein
MGGKLTQAKLKRSNSVNIYRISDTLSKCLCCGNKIHKQCPNGPKRCPFCKSLKWRTKIGPLTQERVRELFDYCDTGNLTWKIKYHPTAEIGSYAGTKSGNYRRVGIDGRSYKLHRIIFLWHHGYLPELVDHDDRDTLNNKIDNLREASKSCNTKNSKIRLDSKTKITGVFRYGKKNKWASYISNNGKRIHIGIFNTLEEAVLARWRKEIELNWNGCNSTSPARLFLKENGLISKKMIVKARTSS